MADEITLPPWLKIKDCNVVRTYDNDHEENGYLIDILNINDEIMVHRRNEQFNQFYMTTVSKNKFKGLHVHPFKTDTLHCVHGKICLVLYPQVVEKSDISSTEINMEKYIFLELGGGYHRTVSYPSKYPHGFFGIDEFSVLINYRVPAWTPDDTFQYDIDHPHILEELKRRYA